MRSPPTSSSLQTGIQQEYTLIAGPRVHKCDGAIRDPYYHANMHPKRPSINVT